MDEIIMEEVNIVETEDATTYIGGLICINLGVVCGGGCISVGAGC